MDSPFLVDLLGFGLAGIAGLSFAEKFLPVLPSYVLLVLFGLTTVHNTTDLGSTIAASTLGSVGGAVVWYSLGKIAGKYPCERLVTRFGKYVFLRPELYRRFMAAYERRHFWVTFIGQTIPTARIYLALPAGVLGLPVAPFVLATTLGTLAWNAPLITTGYLLQDTGCSPTATGIAVGASLLGAEALVILFIRRVQRRHCPAPP